MGKSHFLLVVLAAIVPLLFYRKVSDLVADTEFTQNLPDFHWGPAHSQNVDEDTSVKPFKIKIEQTVLDSLDNKLTEELSSGRFTPTLEGIGFEYGTNSNYLKSIISYWQKDYDWREREKLMNEFPHFTTTIAGLRIHFQHVKTTKSSKYKYTRPLLLLHGWPSCFTEFHQIIPLLVQPENSEVNFEVVIPSLPGFGFSEAASRPGLGLVEMGQIFLKLMNRLGYESFYIEGTDWGSGIGILMSKMFPQNVTAFHSNFCASLHPRSFLKVLAGSLIPSLFYTSEEANQLPSFMDYLKSMVVETGYFHQQATKPATVGVNLSFSPSGLAAYILEKFSGLTNPGFLNRQDGGLPEKYSMDELLDVVMVYWVTNSMPTSIRIYSEFCSRRYMAYELNSVPSRVPSGCLIPRWDVWIYQPKAILQDTFHNLISHSYALDGGHFFPREFPKVLAEDFLQFAKLVEGKQDQSNV